MVHITSGNRLSQCSDVLSDELMTFSALQRKCLQLLFCTRVGEYKVEHESRLAKNWQAMLANGGEGISQPQ